MSRIGSSPKRFGIRSRNDRQQLSDTVFRLRRIDEIEIARLGSGEIGHLPLVDAVRVGDDPALGGLAEDLGQPHDRHGSRCDDVGQNLPRPDRWQLIDIADQQQRRPLRQGTQDRPHQRHVDHRGLVDDQQIAVQGLVLVAPETAGPGIGFEQAVDRLRLEAGALGQALGGAAGRGAQRDRDRLGDQDLQ